MKIRKSMEVQFVKLNELATIPRYSHPGDAGLDLFAIAETVIAPGETGLVKTGIAIALPPGTEAQIRPRSGLALKHSITVLNSPGTIDNGFRGEIGVILINHGKSDFQVSPRMKIAQMVVSSFVRAEMKVISDLGETSRNTGGYGSTGDFELPVTEQSIPFPSNVKPPRQP